MAYSGSKRIRRYSVQSVNFPEDPIRSDMSATASEKASNQASEKADSEKASEKACNVISLITGRTVYTEKYKARGPDVQTDRREVYTKDRGIYIFRIDSPTGY